MISIGLFTLLGILSYIALRNKGINFKRKSLMEIQRTDCCCFDPELYSEKKYFIRKYFVKKSREENYYILSSIVEKKKNII